MLVVMLLAAVVNSLLLVATGILLGERPKTLRLLMGGLLWGVLALLGLLPEFGFLDTVFFRLCGLILSALIAFGFRVRSLQKVLVFLLLYVSVGGMAQASKLSAAIVCGLGISAACLLEKKEQNLIPVELTYRGQTLSITALRDTGNTLRDPITGRQVLVVGADVAGKLTGLTPADLGDPLNTLPVIPGLRLIPYQSVGNTGFMLALNIPDVKIGNRQGSTLVAFSPLILSGRYQALTGGTL